MVISGYRQFSKSPSPDLFLEAQPRDINLGEGIWKLPISRNNHTLNVLLYRYNVMKPI